MKHRRDETEQAFPFMQEGECLKSGGISGAPAAHVGSTCGCVRLAGRGWWEFGATEDVLRILYLCGHTRGETTIKVVIFSIVSLC